MGLKACCPGTPRVCFTRFPFVPGATGMCSVPSQTVFVGLDYHSESIQVCVLAGNGKMLVNRSCRNDWRTVAAAVRERCGPQADVQAAIESCCGAADLADELIAKARLITRRRLSRLAALAKEIRSVERLLARQTAKDTLVQKLLTLKGIGLVTAVTIRAEIGRFDRFRTGKQLARFCGISPRNASSGARQADAGLIRAGNPELRTVLVEAAHRLMRYDEKWGKLAARLSLRGKPVSLITAAVANRWMRWLFHQMQPEALAA